MMKKTLRINVAVLAALPISLLLGACSSTPPDAITNACQEADAMCFEHPEYILECADDGTWTASRCDEGMLCHEGECRDLVCVPGTSICEGDSVVACRDDGQGRLYPEACAAGETCHAGECIARICEGGEMRCVDDLTIERCEGNGSVWTVTRTCQSGTSCVGEICLPTSCAAGETQCGPTELYTCDGSGTWISEQCPDEQPCLFGRCVGCVSHQSCDEGQVCDEGECVETSPVLVTVTLPAGTVGVAYSTVLAVEGGLAPYEWEIVDGALPDGISLGIDGSLQGTPTSHGIGSFAVRVTDANAKFAERDYIIEIVSAGGAPRIMTTSLPPAMHGLPYLFNLQATGGTPPLAWQLLDGPLPLGIELGSSGRLSGTPEQLGSFPLTLRVIDGLTPPAYDSAELTLTVEIAPLEIIGDQEYNLLLTKIIVLPMLIPYVPYSHQLQARGGLVPYTWNEDPPPTGLDWIIPDWGFPSGLSMNASGRISGWVLDVSDATVVSIPFMNISLTGYFFHARVTDSQNPADTITAVFCLPTVPL